MNIAIIVDQGMVTGVYVKGESPIDVDVEIVDTDTQDAEEYREAKARIREIKKSEEWKGIW